MTNWVRQQVGVLHALGWTFLPGVRPFAGAPGIAVAKTDAIRAAAWATIFLTAVFYAPALLGGYFADDHFHVFVLDEMPSLFTERFNLFAFLRSPEEVQILRRWGIAPWWTSDALRIDFFRPIPSLTHWLDFALFGKNAAAAHLVSIGWYLLSVTLVYRVMTRFIKEGSRTLLLAIAIFALDDTHALNVQWLANRNDVIAAVFLMSAFLGWLRLREGNGTRRTNLALLFVGFVAALLSKESSVVFPALVLAHAVILPDSLPDGLPESTAQKLRDRVRPHLWIHLALAAIALVYVVAYFKSGHGPNSIYYINPGKNPGLWTAQFFRSGFFHAVILATGVPLHVLSSSPVRDYPVPAAFVAALTIGFWLVAWKLLRKDRPTRFFVAWMVIAQVILTTSFPDPRILYLPSIGFAYVVARVMQESWARRDEWNLGRPVVITLVTLHLVFAPILDHVCLHVVNSFQDSYASVREGVRKNVDLDNLPAGGQEVFFLNWHQREATALANLQLLRSLPAGADVRPILERDDLSYTQKIDRGFEAMKVHYYSLSFLLGEVDARVLNDHEIALSPKQGQFFPSLFERLYMTSTAFHVGQTVELPAFKATIEALDGNGEVSQVRFTFPKPLSSPSYKFLAYDGAGWVTVNVADAVGGKLALRAAPVVD
ncbi:MAG: glycosyltransferase family 39 protein [Deltaproteobacteria bacterium]|nr:glycosyltransferase family 39 protein [Deltaproteobacteria bacterium]